MRLIQSESYSNRAEWIESHLAGRINPLVKYSYANRNNEDLGGSAKRSGDSNLAASSSKPDSTAARGAARSGIQTAEQMDSRGSVGAFGGTACWGRHVGRDAAAGAANGLRCFFRANVEVACGAVAVHAFDRVR
jgi:hypothetical protein